MFGCVLAFFLVVFAKSGTTNNNRNESSGLSNWSPFSRDLKLCSQY